MDYRVEEIPCDVTTLRKNDIVYYISTGDGGFITEKGTVPEDNMYKDGVEVHGDGWKQYVSEWFIFKVERDGEVIYLKEGTEDFE